MIFLENSLYPSMCFLHVHYHNQDHLFLYMKMIQWTLDLYAGNLQSAEKLINIHLAHEFIIHYLRFMAG